MASIDDILFSPITSHGDVPIGEKLDIELEGVEAKAESPVNPFFPNPFTQHSPLADLSQWQQGQQGLQLQQYYQNLQGLQFNQLAQAQPLFNQTLESLASQYNQTNLTSSWNGAVTLSINNGPPITLGEVGDLIAGRTYLAPRSLTLEEAARLIETLL